MQKIFISYRRDDSSGYAGRLSDHLVGTFGRDSVFMDVDAIGVGADFVQTLEEAVSSCDVMIALIGKRWLEARDANGSRRLDEPDDFVRREIATALNGNGITIPVLVDGAGMPAASDLPDELQPLCRRNAVELQNSRWDYDIAKLMEAIEGAGVEKVRTPLWKQYGVPVVVGAALIVGGIAGYMALSSTRGDIAPHSSHETVEEPLVIRPSVAVLRLRNMTGSKAADWLATAVPEMLSTDLALDEDLRLIASDQVSRLGQDIDLSSPEEAAQYVRRELGADTVVTGGYTMIGEGDNATVRLDLTLINAIDGAVIARIAVSGTQSQLFDLVDRAAADIRDNLGVAVVGADHAVNLKASYPSGVNVMRLYFEALVLIHRYDAVRAASLLEEAIAIDPKHPLPHRALASVSFYLGDVETAQTEIATAQEGAGFLSETERWEIEADALAYRGKWGEASTLYGKLFSRFPDEPQYGIQVVNAHLKAGALREALGVVERLRELPSPMNADPRIALCEAEVRFQTGDYQIALEAAIEAVTLAETSASPLLANARFAQALALRAMGDPGGFEIVGMASTLFARYGNRKGEANALQIQADIVFGRGDLDGAWLLFERAANLYREIGSKVGEGLALLGLAAIQVDRGQIPEAEALLGQAVEAFEAHNRTDEIAHAVNGFGVSLHLQGELKAALVQYQRAMSMFSAQGNQAGLEVTLTNISEIQYLFGDLDTSESMQEEALAIDRVSGDREGIAYDLTRLGMIKAAQGLLIPAKQKFTEALKIQIDLNDTFSAAETRLRFAEAELADGNVDEAEELARGAEQVFRSEGAVDPAGLAQAVLARVLLAKGKTGEATRLSAKAEAAAKNSLDKRLLFSAATVAAEVSTAVDPSTADAAIAALKRTIAEAEQAEFIGYALTARLTKGRIEHSLGRASGRALLTSLIADAESRGFALIAQQAAQALDG